MELVLSRDVILCADFDFLSNRHVSGHELPATLKAKAQEFKSLLFLKCHIMNADQ